MAILFSVSSVSRSSSPATGDQLPLVSVDEPNYAANLQKTMKSTVAFAAITAVAVPVGFMAAGAGLHEDSHQV